MYDVNDDDNKINNAGDYDSGAVDDDDDRNDYNPSDVGSAQTGNCHFEECV